MVITCLNFFERFYCFFSCLLSLNHDLVAIDDIHALLSLVHLLTVEVVDSLDGVGVVPFVGIRHVVALPSADICALKVTKIVIK